MQTPSLRSIEPWGGLEVLQAPLARAVLGLFLGAELFMKLPQSPGEWCWPEFLACLPSPVVEL